MTGRSTARALACSTALGCALAWATAANPAPGTPANKPPAGARVPASAAPAAKRAVVRRPAAGTPGIARSARDQALEARLLEDNGGYSRAATALRAVRSAAAPDADLELALALDEARSGESDSAIARLEGALLARAILDTLPITRRHDYSWEREKEWLNGRYDGWHWYIARARAEVNAKLGRWAEARAAAEACVAARPLAGKEWLILATCAGRAGDPAAAEQSARTALALDASLPETHYLAGVYAWRGGRRNEAQAAFRAAVALDSSWRVPAIALVRSRLPGAAPDSLPTTLLSGVRQVGLLTSPMGPKLEEFVQMDAPATILRREMLPIADSLGRGIMPVQLTLPILVDERGRAVLHDLPWYAPADLPAPIIATIVASLPGWRFSPARRLGEPRRVWAAVSITNTTP